MGPTLWLLLASGGWAILWSMPHFGNATVQAAAIRVAALMFLGAGTVGASGWIGAASTTAVDTANSTGSAATAAVVGTAAIWIVWVGLALLWILTFLPGSIFKIDMWDWLSMLGLVLPSLMAKVPYGPGRFFRSIFDTAGGVMVEAFGHLLGQR